MTPKRLLFRLIVRILDFMTGIRKPKIICNLPLTKQEGKSVDIITVAFNNSYLIRYQTSFIRKFITDSYTRIIVDNSTDNKCRQEIFEYCKENGIAYAAIPKNFLNRIGCSYSHAAALNYAYHHIIMKRRPFAFGQIDHDLFPTRTVSIMEKLRNQPVYGPLRQRGSAWYLSAIMSFFRYDFLCNRKVDFMPVTPNQEYLDSGGGNWYDIYSRLDLNRIDFPNECIENIRTGGNRHSDCLEYFDDKLWLHTINGSLYKVVQQREIKDNIAKDILDSFLSAPVKQYETF